MSVANRLRRLRKQPPEGWDLIEPTLDEFEAKMREAETDPHEGKRRTETLWPIFKVLLYFMYYDVLCIMYYDKIFLRSNSFRKFLFSCI